MVFHPLLPEVAGASLNPDAVVAPLRQMLTGVRCRTETVRNIDLKQQVVEFDAPDGHTGALPYDHLVIACGRSVNLGSVPGMSDHAFPLKSVGDAMALRAHVIQQLENAEVCADPTQRRWYLSFIVVGGGFSGVEVAGEINDLVRHTLAADSTFEDALEIFATHHADTVYVVEDASHGEARAEGGDGLSG